MDDTADIDKKTIALLHDILVSSNGIGHNF